MDGLYQVATVIVRVALRVRAPRFTGLPVSRVCSMQLPSRDPNQSVQAIVHVFPQSRGLHITVPHRRRRLLLHAQDIPHRVVRVMQLPDERPLILTRPRRGRCSVYHQVLRTRIIHKRLRHLVPCLPGQYSPVRTADDILQTATVDVLQAKSLHRPGNVIHTESGHCPVIRVRQPGVCSVIRGDDFPRDLRVLLRQALPIRRRAVRRQQALFRPQALPG